MGLSGRKEKQRIPADPRNLTWADDAAKFGSNYLSKFGWDSSKGLGVNGDGQKSHIRVSHKLDMLGIGAAHHKDPNGIAWKQNKDFEILLKRLNESKATEEAESAVKKKGVESSDVDKKEKKSKRKRSETQEPPEETITKKRKKKNESQGIDKTKDENLIANSPTMDAPSLPQRPYVPRHRAHRARVIASKSIASKSAVAIAEILGIAPPASNLATPSGSTTPQGKLTPLDDGLTIEKITTSAQSVSDYFKEKLLAKPPKSNINHPISALEPSVYHEQDSYDTPRRGLGSSHISLGRPEADTNIRRNEKAKLSFISSSSSTISATIFSTEAKQKLRTGLPDNNPGIEMGQKEKSKTDLSKEERRRARAEKKALKQKRREDSTRETH